MKRYLKEKLDSSVDQRNKDCINSKDNFEKISRTYDKIHLRVIKAIHLYMENKHYKCVEGKSVLDLGSGGRNDFEELGNPSSNKPSFYVGLDNSISMLARKTGTQTKVLSDGMALPFKDCTFDYVIVCGVLHHLGFDRDKTCAERVKKLLSEALRVSIQGVIVYEPLTHDFLEKIECMIFKIVNESSIYMLSPETLDRILRDMDVKVELTSTKTLSQLTHPFYFYPLVMMATWLRIPAFLSPIFHHFFVLRPSTD